MRSSVRQRGTRRAFLRCMTSRHKFASLFRVVTFAGALVALIASPARAQTGALSISETHDSDGNDREAILVNIEARVSFPKAICADGLAWLQNLSIPPFAPMDPSAAYFNALPSHYSQLSKLNYATVFLNAIATGHFSPTNPGNARRLVLATGSEVVGLRLAKSEKWHVLWWLPQTLSIGMNLGDLRSHTEAENRTELSRVHVLPLPARSHPR